MGTEYLELIRTGNILFQNWNAIIYCNESFRNTIKVNFGVKEKDQNIIALRSIEKTTINSINKTIKFLKICNTAWLSHLTEKRKRFNEFNYFRISQISKLRTQLAEFINDDSNVEARRYKDLFDLLVYLNKEVDVNMLNQANKFAFENSQMELKTGQETVEVEVDKKIEIPNELSNNQLEQNVFEKLEKSGFSRATIRNAIQNCQTLDIDALIDYCFGHELNDSVINENTNNNITISDTNTQNLLNLDDLKSDLFKSTKKDPYDDDSVDYLEKKYHEIWSTFSKFLDCNFDHCISLNHLGFVLRHLKTQSKRLVKRQKPNYLDYNTPNLIVCPRDDIIRRALSIYSLTADQPLPGDDEILYCNSATTFEEIELFWRRVLFGQDDKIYTLINVQDLVYDQAVKAHTAFEQMFSNFKSTKSFTLCIICSSEKEDKSVFATTFNRYRKNIPFEKDLDIKLRSYLTSHFKFDLSLDVSLKKIETDALNVKIVTSERSGTGKSLYVKRQIEMAQRDVNKNIKHCCISIKKQCLPFEEVFRSLKAFESECYENEALPRIYHIDIAYEVWYEVDYFLFSLLCLSQLKSKNGRLFRRLSNDLFLIEIMTPKFRVKNSQETLKPLHSILTILPTLDCLMPFEIFECITNNRTPRPPLLFDETILRSEMIQRPCQYLQQQEKTNNFDNFQFLQNTILGADICLNLLLKHLEKQNASWSEIIHFAFFLNTQLVDCENSIYCGKECSDILRGFKTFVVKFMIQMSHDFALPSLEISDCSALKLNELNKAEFQLDQLKMRRTWEKDPHPYLFFNPDGQTFTFFGFYVNKANGELIDMKSKQVLFDNKLVLSKELIQGIDLQNQKILTEDISKLTKLEKIEKLLNVMGVKWATHGQAKVVDPDPSYELTMDNLLKIIAIYMRLRSGIPVIIMGETGCGKTRLCKYMCELHKNPNDKKKIKNMYLVKVHGGTTAEEIKHHVQKAQKLAKDNSKIYPEMFTILFFDEANSTEAIGTIKEIMCDLRIDGKEIEKNTGLKIIAACNPYKKHSEEIIKNFEKSGLGFYIDMNETQEKLGDLPMRHLVYRVQPLPASMMPIIWDFGQLGPDVEKLYIDQIVKEKFENTFGPDKIQLISTLLWSSQNFMKNLKNECSFVSLRDIQRVLKVIDWFMKKGQNIFNQIERKKNTKLNKAIISNLIEPERPPITLQKEEIVELVENSDDTDDQEELEDLPAPMAAGNPVAKNLLGSIILALNACYHCGLQSEDTRREFRNEICNKLKNSYNVDEKYLRDEIDYCYEVFLDEINPPEAIARNQALKENIFMMLICVELKIPLFLIGKPGSSKSLSKNLISFKMQGSDRLNSTVLSNFKEAQLITFQCSPMSTSEMILNTFRYCASYQLERENDLDRYTSVVVLDEIGLAEASASMPLKTLHPLLEDGVCFEEKDDEKTFIEKAKQKKSNIKSNLQSNQNKESDTEDWHRVGFIGISNWVLDPAKMNRGKLLFLIIPL